MEESRKILEAVRDLAKRLNVELEVIDDKTLRLKRPDVNVIIEFTNPSDVEKFLKIVIRFIRLLEVLMV